MRNCRSVIMATLCVVTTFGTNLSRAESLDGNTVFNTCAACHMPTGEGLPGAFPPLLWLTDTYVKDGGKEYLISVVLQGLNGPIESQGQAYNGYMQAFATSLTDDEVAGVLNYVLTRIVKSPVEESPPINGYDVASVRKKIADKTLPTSHALRQKLND